MADLRIAVCVPGDRWHSGFGYDLTNALICFANSRYMGGKKEVEVFSVTGSILPEVRTRLVAQAAEWGATHMLFLDDDMRFPRDVIQCLIRHNLPVVGANYSRRTHPIFTTAYTLDKSGPLLTRPEDRDLVEVSHLGTGCVLIDMRVFEMISLPFFAFQYDETGKMCQGEDVYFCHKLAEAGIPCYVDQELSQMVKHLGEWEFDHRQALMVHEEREAERGKLATVTDPE